jgi:ATP-dependent DNA ligase
MGRAASCPACRSTCYAYANTPRTVPVLTTGCRTGTSEQWRTPHPLNARIQRRPTAGRFLHVARRAVALYLSGMLKRKLPAGFIVPAQPVERDKPPARADWVHELKHDGYRLIVHRRGAIVRLRGRNGVDYTDRLPAIVSAAEGIGIPSFTIDGEAVVVGPDGLSHFEELRRKESAWSAPLSLRFNRA